MNTYNASVRKPSQNFYGLLSTNSYVLVPYSFRNSANILKVIEEENSREF